MSLPRLLVAFPLAAAVAEALGAAGLTLAVAESCTGGLLGATLTAVPGASAWMLGGVIAYSNDVKTRLLGVPADLIERNGAVSEEVARLLAGGARHRFGSDVGIGITGVAGPATEGTKPAGLIHVAISGPGHAAGHARLEGDHGREANRARAVTAALGLCLGALAQAPG